jgi:hypothetical protein
MALSPKLQGIIDSFTEQIDFADDSLEVLVEKAFLAGGLAMQALFVIDAENSKLETPQELDDYISGISGLTRSVGDFFNKLDDAQVAAYRESLKKVIVNSNPAIESALEQFADANLDLTAAINDVNDAIDSLNDGSEL